MTIGLAGAMALELMPAALKQLDNAIEFLEKALAQAPTKEGLDAELAAREQRIAQLRAALSAAQAADQAALDARIPR